MRLIFVRHGKTADNAQDILQGHADTPLSALGIAQAERIAARLKTEKLHAIYSSDLERACATAQQIARDHRIPVHLTSKLREQDLGSVGRIQRKEYIRLRAASRMPIAQYRTAGGESLEDVQTRALGFLRELEQHHASDTVLIVTHAGWLRMLLAKLLEKSIEEGLEMRIPNGSITVIEKIGSTYIVHALGDTTHLD